MQHAAYSIPVQYFYFTLILAVTAHFHVVLTPHINNNFTFFMITLMKSNTIFLRYFFPVGPKPQALKPAYHADEACACKRV